MDSQEKRLFYLGLCLSLQGPFLPGVYFLVAIETVCASYHRKVREAQIFFFALSSQSMSREFALEGLGKCRSETIMPPKCPLNETLFYYHTQASPVLLTLSTLLACLLCNAANSFRRVSSLMTSVSCTLGTRVLSAVVALMVLFRCNI